MGVQETVDNMLRAVKFSNSDAIITSLFDVEEKPVIVNFYQFKPTSASHEYVGTQPLQPLSVLPNHFLLSEDADDPPPPE